MRTTGSMHPTGVTEDQILNILVAYHLKKLDPTKCSIYDFQKFGRETWPSARLLRLPQSFLRTIVRSHDRNPAL